MDKLRNLKFNIQLQAETNWCWAAVGTSCALAYNPDSGWTQCSLAKECLGFECCGEIDDNYCNVSNADKFNYCRKEGLTNGNRNWHLDNADGVGVFKVKDINIANGRVEGPITFQRLVDEIDAGFLVAFLIQNPTYANKDISNHFVVVSGYSISNGIEKVTVQDPEDAETTVLSYEKFKTNFDKRAVIESYFTKADTPLEPEIIPFFPNKILGAIGNMSNKLKGLITDAKNKEAQNFYVYDINWQDILEEKNLEKAYSIEKRCFLKDNTNRLCAFKLDENDNISTDEVNFGKGVIEHKQLIETFQNSIEFLGLKHSLLRIPLLKITAIWFRTNNSEIADQDKFIPLRPSFYGLKAGEVYSFKEFMPKVIDAAQKFKEAIS